jgi:serine/threonine protein kinase
MLCFSDHYHSARIFCAVHGTNLSARATLYPIHTESDHADLGPQWFLPSQTTPESRDIIVAMLNPDPIERLNIQQVLVHPWISLQFVKALS